MASPSRPHLTTLAVLLFMLVGALAPLMAAAHGCEVPSDCHATPDIRAGITHRPHNSVVRIAQAGTPERSIAVPVAAAPEHWLTTQLEVSPVDELLPSSVRDRAPPALTLVVLN